MYNVEYLTSDEWTDYELIDCGDGNRLERWGNITLIRPEPQALWPKSAMKEWKNVDAIYKRSKSGGGRWEFIRKVPESWNVKYKDLVFRVQPTGFKHTGIFPEQAVNWDRVRNALAGNEKVLNLFGYTGCASVAAASSGASVVHVDASKGALSWCKENASLSKIKEGNIRLILDDCLKFVEREGRRGNTYEGIIMDPPSFGRGAKGEVWKLEDSLWNLLLECSKILSKNAKFILINSYTSGVSPFVIANMVSSLNLNQSDLSFGELMLPFRNNNMSLPCGITLWANLKKI